MSRPFTDFELCGIIMRSCPQVWQDTYFLMNEEVPTNVERLLTKYEAIEQLEDTKKRASESKDERARKKAKKVAANGNNFKAKSGDGFRIPKKQRPALAKFARKGKLHCHRCKEHGGAYTNHNTKDCEKYDGNGKLLPGWKGKPSAKSGNRNSNMASAADAHAFMQLSAKFEKLKKKVKTGKGKKRKRYDSDSDESDDSY